MIDTVPFQVFLGRLPTGLSTLERDDGSGSQEIQNARVYGHMAYNKLLQEAQSTHSHVVKTQASMASDHDRRAHLVTYRIHDLVWLFTPCIQQSDNTPPTEDDIASRKVHNYWGKSPWVITALHNPSNATIRNIRGDSQRVHFARLRPYISPLPNTTTTGPDGRPVIIHHIISSRNYGHTSTFRVRWFPFNIKPDSNVPKSDIPVHLLLNFENRQHTSPSDDIACDICTHTDNPADMLLCDGCDHGFHNPCLGRQAGDIPSGTWFCPSCTPFVAQQTDSSPPIPTMLISS